MSISTGEWTGPGKIEAIVNINDGGALGMGIHVILRVIDRDSTGTAIGAEYNLGDFGDIARRLARKVESMKAQTPSASFREA